MSDTKGPAVIVFRHGCDGGKSDPFDITFADNIAISYTGKYHNISGQAVHIENDWLGVLGHKQAKALGTYLPTWLNNKYAPVSRIVTENPGDGTHGTPNPLDTVTPFMKGMESQIASLPGGKLKLCMYDNTSFEANAAIFKGSSLLQDGNYSTVISWEAMGMWRKSEGDYVTDSILGTLVKDNTNPMVVKHSPRKGQTVYIFTGLDTASGRFDTLEVYDFNPDNGAMTLLPDTNWPDKLCTKAEQH